MDDINANEFLTIKSTEQQKREGVERPVDTAFVEEHDGELILKAVFDVHHFKPEEVSLKVYCFFLNEGTGQKAMTKSTWRAQISAKTARPSIQVQQYSISL